MDAYTAINVANVDLSAVQKEAARLKMLAELFDFNELITETLESIKVRLFVCLFVALFAYRFVRRCCAIPLYG